MARTIVSEGMERLYKIVNRDGSPCHGGDPSFRWPLPEGDTAGEWVEVNGPLALCKHPCLHLTTDPAFCLNELGGDPATLVCYLAEYDGAIVRDDSTHKVGVRRARLIAPVAWSDVRVYVDGEHTASGSVHVRASGSARIMASDDVHVTASGSAHVTASDWAHVTAYGSVHVTASGSAHVRAYDSVQVTAYGDAQVIASGSVHVTAYDSVHVRASGSVHVGASGSSQVTASDSAQVAASGSAQVRASGSSQVTASGSSQVRAYDSVQVAASDYATVVSTTSHDPRVNVALSQMAVHVDRRRLKLTVRQAEVA